MLVIMGAHYDLGMMQIPDLSQIMELVEIYAHIIYKLVFWLKADLNPRGINVRARY